MDFSFVYKICTKVEWLEAKTVGIFKGSQKDLEDGYIHFSDREQLKKTLKKFFFNQKDLILLKIETIKLKHLVYEQASDGGMFPHLYCFLEVSNVVGEFDIILINDGSYVLPINF